MQLYIIYTQINPNTNECRQNGFSYCLKMNIKNFVKCFNFTKRQETLYIRFPRLIIQQYLEKSINFIPQSDFSAVYCPELSLKIIFCVHKESFEDDLPSKLWSRRFFIWQGAAKTSINARTGAGKGGISAPAGRTEKRSTLLFMQGRMQKPERS